MSEQAMKTPLLELLDAVPRDATCAYASETHHRLIPCGRLCFEAAEEIRRLRKVNGKLIAERAFGPNAA